MAIHFKIKLAPAIATAIVLPILMTLGFWQLDRAEIKQHALNTYKARTEQAAIKLSANDKPASINLDELQYASLEVTGHYDTKHSFLIDNRVHQQQVGFYVVTPFLVENSNNVILVNRGWIKAKRYRTELPDFSTNNQKLSLKGVAYSPSKNFFAVENVKIESQAFPLIIQNINFLAISEVLGKDIYPFLLRLDPKDKTGFIREWKVITSSPEKSQSYAAQWFTMALIVAIIFLSSCTTFKREKAA